MLFFLSAMAIMSSGIKISRKITMLILSRKLNESILIGKNQDIVVTLVEASNGRVRLGIVAPPEVPVLREELRDATKRQPVSKKLPGVL